MKFKVGDRVRVVYPHHLVNAQLGEVWRAYRQDAIPYTVKLDGGGFFWGATENLELIDSRTPTEGRLIEALRPFAEKADHYWQPGECGEPYRSALTLLRELGEYPKTCKTCGQEIRRE